jgi:5-methylthioadenosine/S-adenosylhomocysteine deaminase
VSERALVHASFAIPAADAEPIADAGILIEDRSILSVGPFSDVRRAYPLASERSADGLVALPGFVDAHSHGRGLSLAEQGVREGPLELFLAQLTACTALDPRDDAYVAGSDLLATGVTTVQVFFHSTAPDEEYRQAARAAVAGLGESGIDYEFVLGFTDQAEFVPPSVAEAPPGAEVLWDPVRSLDADDFLGVYDELAADETHLTLGPVAPQWCSDHAWRGIALRAKEGARVHTHLLESHAQRVTLEPSPVETLRSHGVLNGRLSAAHAVWLTETEIDEVAAAGAALVHCPASNRRLAGRNAPVRSWLEAGVSVALGLDSYSRADPPDVFDELRAAREAAAGGLDAREAMRLATRGGGYALGRPEVGSLAPGSAANMVLMRAPERDGDIVEELLGHATRHDVVEVWANGSLRVEDGRLRDRRSTELARARLRAALANDAAERRRRLAHINTLEPWLAEIWSLEPATAPGRTV